MKLYLEYTFFTNSFIHICRKADSSSNWWALCSRKYVQEHKWRARTLLCTADGYIVYVHTFLFLSLLLLVYRIALRYAFSLLKSRSFGLSREKKKSSIHKCEFDWIAVGQMQIQKTREKNMWMLLNVVCSVLRCNSG